MLKIKILILRFTVLLIFFGAPMLVWGAEKQENLFKVENELQISTDDMDCNYQIKTEEFGKRAYNFEYPKLIVNDGSDPLIAFVDEKSDKLIFAEIVNHDVRNVYSLPSSQEHRYQRWPVVFSKGNQTYFSLFSENDKKSYRKIKIFLFDSINKKLQLQKEEPFNTNQPCDVWGVYPYKKNFMIISTCSDICWYRAPRLLFHGEAIFFHNASFNLGGNKKLSRQSIENKGCYSVYKQAYDSSISGTIHAAWVRFDKSSGRYSHDEIVNYSSNKDGNKWEPHVEIYSAKNIGIDAEPYHQIEDLSLASFGKSAFILWQDVKSGIFFTEIRDGIKKDDLKISNIIQPVDYNDPLGDASDIKIASDHKGNVYALWTQNSGRDYRLFIRARIDGKWTEEIIINKGDGYLKLPDMKIDNKGAVHITYIRSVHPYEPRKTQWGGRFGCYYMKLMRR